MIKKLWRLLKPFHKVFGGYLGLIVVYEALQIVEGYVISGAIRLFGEKTELLVWAGLVVGLLVYDELFMRLDNAVDWHIIVRHEYPIYRFLKTKAISKFLEMEMAWHQKRNSGALVGKVNRGVSKVVEILEALSWEFIPTLIQAILTIIPLLIFSPWVVGVAAVALFVFMWVSIVDYRRRKPLKKRRHDHYEEEWARSTELVQSVETARMFGQEERFLHEYRSLHNAIVTDGSTEAKIGIYFSNRWRLRVLSVARRSILAIWVWQLYQGTLDIAGLVYVSILTEKLFHSFWRFARLFTRASEASESAARLVDLLEQQPLLVGGPVSEHQTVPPIGITMKDVCFSYSGKYDGSNGALRGLSLTIEPGQIVALVGPSGAGKTTVRKLITGLWRTQRGRILVGGIDITEWSPSVLLQLFSYVPQGDDVFIFDATICENIAFARPEASLEEIARAAELAGIRQFIESLPEEYQTRVGERGIRLSGGQKQRVALARAILADSPILILDEATNAVDAITEREIQTQMKVILDGKTAIIIAHNLSTIRRVADKIVVLDGGRKVAEGTHEWLVGNCPLYAEMVRLQTGS